MLYRKILKQALFIAWKFKYLWFFGLFVSLLGNGGEYEIFVKLMGSPEDKGYFDFSSIASTGVFSGEALVNIGKNPTMLILPLVILVLFLILFGFIAWLAITSQAAIVNNASKVILAKTKSVKLGISEGVAVGMRKFWPVLGFNAIIKVIALVALALISVPLVGSITGTSSITTLLFVILFTILMPLSIAIAFVLKFAICFSIVKDQTFIESLKNGWLLFKKNWLVSTEMAFILFVINILVGFLLIFAISILSIPMLFVVVSAYQAISASASTFFLGLSIILLILLIMLVGSMLAVFQVSSWTGLFIELIGRGGESKIVRLLKK